MTDIGESIDLISDYLSDQENMQDTINNISAQTGLDIDAVISACHEYDWFIAHVGGEWVLTEDHFDLQPDTLIGLEGV